jgi:dTDP-4-dehydrorhamnose reductase
MFRQLSSRPELDVHAAVRESGGLATLFPGGLLQTIITDVDVNRFDTIIRACSTVRPEIVINCIGLVKQLPIANEPIPAISINALLPHRLAVLCRAIGARLIHFSTDCVFDGAKGNYRETDPPTATDLYGISKYLGEVAEPPHCVTLRTSIIGHEIKGRHGLVEWFLAETGRVRGFTKAIYSGFPTVEMALIVAERVIPNPDLIGIFHVSSDPISKYDLLGLVAKQYERPNEIDPYGDVRIDRSLDSSEFRRITGYVPPAWPVLVARMHEDYRTFYQRI